MLQSTDGITWQNISQAQYAGLNFNQITYTNGQYSVLTNSTTYNMLLNSSDGLTWTPLNGLLYFTALNGLYAANNTYFSFASAGLGLVNANIHNLSSQSSAVILNNSFIAPSAPSFRFTAVKQ